MLSMDHMNDPKDWLADSLPSLASLAGTEAVFLVEPEEIQLAPYANIQQQQLTVKSTTLDRQFGDCIRNSFVGYDQEGYSIFEDNYITQQHKLVRYHSKTAIHDALLYNLGRWRECKLYHDGYQPIYIERQMALSIPLPQGESLLVFGYKNSNVPALNGECHQLLDLMLPAFEGNVRFRQRLSDIHSNWIIRIDQGAEALVVFSADGEEYHRNATLRRLLSTEPCADSLVEALRAFADQLRALLSPQSDKIVATCHNITLGSLSYSLRGHIDRLLFSVPMLIISVERTSVLPSPASLHAAFNLTPREVEVTQLLVQGFTDREVADKLVISVHTARRHSESILRKIGISSRVGIAHACRKLDL